MLFSTCNEKSTQIIGYKMLTVILFSYYYMVIPVFTVRHLKLGQNVYGLIWILIYITRYVFTVQVVHEWSEPIEYYTDDTSLTCQSYGRVAKYWKRYNIYIQLIMKFRRKFVLHWMVFSSLFYGTYSGKFWMLISLLNSAITQRTLNRYDNYYNIFDSLVIVYYKTISSLRWKNDEIVYSELWYGLLFVRLNVWLHLRTK